VQTGDHVVYLGHGARDRLHVPKRLLRQEEVLFDTSNIGDTGRVVVAVACHSATDLGRMAGDPGNPLVEAYVGWLEEMGFPKSNQQPLLDALDSGLEGLFNGRTVAQVVSDLETEFSDAHDRYRNSLTMRSADRRAGQLEANYWKDRIRADGNLAATV
jgi:hypothetical protein